jgi:hypothetical protein
MRSIASQQGNVVLGKILPHRAQIIDTTEFRSLLKGPKATAVARGGLGPP